MLICVGFCSNLYYEIFKIIQFTSIIFLFFFFLRNIINLWNYPNNSYDRIDKILIYLSEIQLIILFVRLCLNYNIFSVLVSINKFSQNLMICSLLMIIILGKYSNSKTKIINYFLITLLITDILLFLIGIGDNESFKQSNVESLSNVITAFFCAFIDIIISFKSFLFKIETNNKINENFYQNKLVSLNTINDKDNDNENNNNDERNSEGDFLNTILNQHLNNAITILSVYFNILIPFFISYCVEIILYFFFNSNINEEENQNSIVQANNTNTIYNISNINITNITSDSNFTNNFENSCIFMEENNNFKNLYKIIICFIFFLLRDFLPYFMIYLMFFHYKVKFHKRVSF